MARPRHLLRRVLLGGALALLALPVGGWAWLRSAAGQAFVKVKVLELARTALPGRLEVGSLEVGLRSVHATGLTLFTPEGTLVAELEELDASYSLQTLLEKTVTVRQARLLRPRLTLVSDERGLNLVRAVSAPAAASSNGPGARWVVRVEALELLEGEVDYRDADRHLAVEGLDVRGNAKVTTAAPFEVSGALTIAGRATSPVTGALAATLAVESGAHSSLSLDLADLKVRAGGEWQTRALTVEQVFAPPDLVRAFLPSWPVKVPVSLHGTVTSKHAELIAEAAGGTVEAKGDWSLDPVSARAVTISAKAVPIDQLLGVTLPSSLSVEATGDLLDARPESLEGQLHLDAAWVAEQRLASVKGELHARGGEATIDTLRVLTPGTALEVSGVASLRQLALEGTLTATDLARLPATLQAFAGVGLPALGGSGVVRLKAHGATAHPGVTAVGQLHSLRVAGLWAEHLELDARLLDARAPLDASFELHARRLLLSGTASAPGRSLDEVQLKAVTHARRIELELQTLGLGDLAVRLSGLLDEDLGGARLDQLALDASTCAWRLDAPTHLQWLAGQLELGALSLHDGDQRLVAAGRLSASEVSADVKLENLVLERLPRALVPNELAGVLSAQLRLAGPRATPHGEAHLLVKGGRLGEVHAVEGQFDASLKDDRVGGTVSLRSSQGALAGDFELPYRGLLEQRADPLRAHLLATDVDLGTFEAMFDAPLVVGGVLGADVQASGTAAKPELVVTVKAPQVTLDVPTRDGRPLVVGQPVVTLRTADDSTLRLEVHASLFDGTVAAVVDTPFTIAALRRHVPTLEELQRTRAHASVDLEHLGLIALNQLRVVDSEQLAGAVGLTGTLDGTFERPTAELTLTGAGLALPPFAKVEVAVQLHVTEHELKVDGTLGSAQHPGLEVKASLAAGARELAQLDVLATRALSVRLKADAFELAEVLVGEEGRKAPSGTISGTAVVSGTLEAPKVSLDTQLERLVLEQTALGAAHLEVHADSSQQVVKLTLGGDASRHFELNGHFGVPLSFSRLKGAGLVLGEAPLTVDLTSQGLDLGFLSGVIPMVRVVAGTLDAKGAVTGTFAAPAFTGQAHLVRGRVALLGYGDYRDLALDVSATNDGLDVSKLMAHAGGGVAELRFKLNRVGSGVFTLTGTADTTTFPIVVDDQALASVSLKATLEGQVSRTLVDLRATNLPRVDVVLPELARKDLQGLEVPADIIILESGGRTARQQLARARSAASPASPIAMQLTVSAPRNIWVRGADLNLELGLSEGFRLAVGDRAQLSGAVNVLRGDLAVIGRKFTLQAGSSVRFSGPPDQPLVDVRAKHVNDKEKVTVTATALGRGTNVSLKVSSDPPLSETDIYTLLATGRLKLERGASSVTPEDAASAVGQLAASQLRTTLAKQLPIDVLSFQAADNFARVTFDVGKYLSDRLYLGFTVQTGADPAKGENPYAARLEYQLSKRWSLEATAGTAPAAGADVVWSMDF